MWCVGTGENSHRRFYVGEPFTGISATAIEGICIGMTLRRRTKADIVPQAPDPVVEIKDPFLPIGFLPKLK
jgi:hypothetical protein